MDTNEDQEPGIGAEIIALHRTAGIEAESLTPPDDHARLWQEDVRVGPFRGHVRMRRGGYAKLQTALDGADMAFVSSGREDEPPLVVLTLDAYRQLLRAGAE